MTDLDTGPSSIRDDSICESSLPPNKSSGDIGERLRDLKPDTPILDILARLVESAVAAAWEEAAKIAEDTPTTVSMFLTKREADAATLTKLSIVSAIRAAVSKKTAESGHSPSTHNSESE